MKSKACDVRRLDVEKDVLKLEEVVVETLVEVEDEEVEGDVEEDVVLLEDVVGELLLVEVGVLEVLKGVVVGNGFLHTYGLAGDTHGFSGASYCFFVIFLFFPVNHFYFILYVLFNPAITT